MPTTDELISNRGPNGESASWLPSTKRRRAHPADVLSEATLPKRRRPGRPFRRSRTDTRTGDALLSEGAADPNPSLSLVFLSTPTVSRVHT